jgi:hypothetical protein
MGGTGTKDYGDFQKSAEIPEEEILSTDYTDFHRL